MKSAVKAFVQQWLQGLPLMNLEAILAEMNEDELVEVMVAVS
jgi:hypothetical protein